MPVLAILGRAEADVWVVPVILFVLVVLLGGLALRQKHHAWHQATWRQGWEGSNGLSHMVLFGAGLGLFTLAVALSVGASYRLYGPVRMWSVKGYGIGEAGSILARAHRGVHGLAYPLNIPLQVALFFMADGDALPGSKFLYPIYGLALCVSVFAFLRRQKLGERTAGLGAVFLGSVPIVFLRHQRLRQPTLHGSPRRRFILGDRRYPERVKQAAPTVGSDAWPGGMDAAEGILYALIVLALILAIYIGKRRRLTPLGALFAPVIAFAGSWFLFSDMGNTIAGSTPGRQVLAYASQTGGKVDLSGLWTIFRVFSYSMFVPYRAMFPAISATYWGALFAVAIGMIVVSVRNLSPHVNPSRFWLLVLAGCFALVTVLEFYVQS